MNSWRNFLNESVEWVGFHGMGGRPTETALKGRGGGLYQLGCLEDFYNEDTGEGSYDNPSPDGIMDTWETEGNGGCPQFKHTEIVDQDDIDLAVRFLNDRKPINLVAYSRGGAVAYLAMKSPKLKHRPNIYYVASAWRKQGNPPAGIHAGGYVIHGTHDVRIPLSDSFELSIITGLPLAIFPKFGHLKDILDVGQQPQLAETILTAQQAANLPWQLLPKWSKKIPYWEISPDENAGIQGKKSSQIINIEQTQQAWYEKHVLGKNERKSTRW